MRKLFKYYLPLLLLLFWFNSCEDYLDVNDDPNRLTEVGLNSLLPAIELRLADAQYSATQTAAQVTQQTGSYFGYFENSTMAGTWSTLYLRVLANANILAQQAATAKAPNYEGIGYALQAYGLTMLTDIWEAAPWTQAFDGSNNLEPAYDDQPVLYNEISSLLDRALPLLQYTPVDCTAEICVAASSDLIYGGDLDKWIKMVYALRARLAVHLLNKGNANATAAISAASQAFASNDDDFEFAYNAVTRNPWHTDVALANNTGNLTVAQGVYAVQLLNGDIYNVIDPRREILLGEADGGNYVGVNSYDDNAPTNTVDFTVDTYQSREQTPMAMLTYAEMKFIEAEANLQLGQSGPAYTAYLAGIQASMDKYGVADAAAYLSDPAVAVGAANLTLDLVMKEKYLAMYLNYEVWTDMRRHNYATAVYRGFVVPDTQRWGGPAQRALFPIDEFNRNGTEVGKVVRSYSTPMWRDGN